jgi:DNA gyrase subunit A
MSVIRADQVAAEADLEAHDGAASDVQPQYVFTMTDGGFAKRTRITDYRQQSRGGLGIKTMSLANEDRGGLVGAFIVVEGDEILSITQAGQVVRSPINAEFRPTGRDTMGVKFVTPKAGDAVAVVTRSVETPEVTDPEPEPDGDPDPGSDLDSGPESGLHADTEAGAVTPEASTDGGDESPDVGTDATIDDETASPEESS